jgi:glycogen debranching enzyme
VYAVDLRSEAFELLRRNRRVSDGHQYTVPSSGIYPYQWLWDSCFHAIVLAKFDPAAAMEELRSLFARQQEDGLVPHIIFWDPKITRPYDKGWGWGKEGVSSITQPPMIAYAVREIYAHTGDRAFLEEVFPKMLAFYRYLIDKRDPRDHHLIGIINPDESGEDNSPRFDVPLGVPSDISFLRHFYERHKLVAANRTCDFDAERCMKEHFWVKDVPFNSILVKNLDILAELAALLNDGEAERFARLHAGLIKDAMRERLFEGGVYWSAWGNDHVLLKTVTWAHFAPLFAGLYTSEEAANVIRTHFSEGAPLRSAFGIRTVSKEEAAYRPSGFWRGPIWFAPHWFIYKGLRDYGFHAEADWIREASAALVEKNGFREYFNPETGRPHGAHQFTWGTLVTDMMEEHD